MWLAEKFEHLVFSLPFCPPAAVEVKEGSFPHLLDQLNQLAKGQHRARLRWVLLERPVAIISLIRPRPEIPDNSHDVLATFPGSPKQKASKLTFSATEGNYIAGLKRMALRLTPQSDTHRADGL